MAQLTFVGASNKSYDTLSMQEGFKGEENGHFFRTKVEYLSEEERKDYELFVRDGRLVDSSGQGFDTTASRSAFGSKYAIFVMGPEGRIFASKTHTVGKFHHSSFLAGKDVAAAGEIDVRNGVVKRVTNRSGHYHPPWRYVDQFLDELKARGVTIDAIERNGYGS